MEGKKEVAEENKEKVLFVDVAREAVLEEGPILKRMCFCGTAGSPCWGRSSQGNTVSKQLMAGQGHS